MYKLTTTTDVILVEIGLTIPADPANEYYAKYLNWLGQGNKPLPVDQPTQQQIMVSFSAAIQKRLDEFARTRNYDGILSACTYATSTVVKFKAEGQACVNLRDATWLAAYNILAHVQAGTRPMPTSIADIEADLPMLEWPA